MAARARKTKIGSWKHNRFNTAMAKAAMTAYAKHKINLRATSPSAVVPIGNSGKEATTTFSEDKVDEVTYRIEVQDEQKTNVYAPADEDVYVIAEPAAIA